MRDYDSLDYLKKKARWNMKDAIRHGKMVRGPCEVGVDCEGPVDGHHDDYFLPLVVRWLCRRHHISLHHPTARRAKKPSVLGSTATQTVTQPTAEKRVTFSGAGSGDHASV